MAQVKQHLEEAVSPKTEHGTFYKINELLSSINKSHKKKRIGAELVLEEKT